jgi:4-hydroxy-tetrahydrodipicolinate reductase
MSMPVKSVHMGLGPIGLGILRMVAAKPWAEIVGGTDVNPDLQGQDLGVMAGLAPIGVAASPSFYAVGPAGTADVVVHCAGSFLRRGVLEQILEALDWDANVVSTCEELAFPWYRFGDEAARIDTAAKKAGRTVIATGINPGFAMDATNLYLSGACERVDAVRVHRVLDASIRRGPFQRKIGAGITTDEFAAKKATGTFGHIGLPESIAMICAGLGWDLESVTETLEPVIADREITTDYAHVVPGSVAGIHQEAHGFVGGHELVTLTMDAFVGAPDPGDTVTLEGRPTLRNVLTGLHGDICTAAMTTNAIGAVEAMRPGLLTMLDAAPVHCRQR